MGYLKVRTPLKFMVPRDRTELPTQGFSVLKIAILFQVVILSRIPILGVIRLVASGNGRFRFNDTCSPKLYDINLKIASWTSLLLLALSSSQRGGLSLLPHKSNSVSPPAKLVVSQFTNKEVGSHALTFTIMFLEIFPKKSLTFFGLKHKHAFTHGLLFYAVSLIRGRAKNPAFFIPQKSPCICHFQQHYWIYSEIGAIDFDCIIVQNSQIKFILQTYSMKNPQRRHNAGL